MTPDEAAPDARLEPLRAAYAIGDHATLRRLLSTLDGVSPQLPAEALEELALLRARVAIDPVQVGVLLACLALFCAVLVTHVH